MAALLAGLLLLLVAPAAARATVFTAAADDRRDDGTIDGARHTNPPVEFTRVSVSYDDQAGRVDVQYVFGQAPGAGQTVWAGVGLGATGPDGSCNAPDFTPRGGGAIGGWDVASFQGQAVVQGFWNESGGARGVRSVVYPGMALRKDETVPLVFDWSAGPAQVLNFAVVRPELVGQNYSCARFATAARDPHGGSVDRLNGEPLALRGPTGAAPTPAPGAPTPAPAPTPILDADGDRFTPEQGDCDDRDPGLNPGTHEIFGNTRDEDCDGRFEPFPVVDTGLGWDVDRQGLPVRFRLVNLRGGEKIELACRGSGCRRRVLARRDVRRRTPVVRLDRAIRGLRLRTGTRLIAEISRDGFATRVWTLRIRRGERPEQKRVCVLPSKGRDADCDGFRDLPSLRAEAKLRTAPRGVRTLIRAVEVRRLRGGEVISLSCNGGGCTRELQASTTAAERDSSLRLSEGFGNPRLRSRARVELAVSKPGFVTRVFRWTMRARKQPKLRLLCQEPDERRPTHCRSA